MGRCKFGEIYFSSRSLWRSMGGTSRWGLLSMFDGLHFGFEVWNIWFGQLCELIIVQFIAIFILTMCMGVAKGLALEDGPCLHHLSPACRRYHVSELGKTIHFPPSSAPPVQPRNMACTLSRLADLPFADLFKLLSASWQCRFRQQTPGGGHVPILWSSRPWRIDELARSSLGDRSPCSTHAPA